MNIILGVNHKFQNLTIGKKIALGFTSILVLTAILATLGVIQIRTVDTGVMDLADVHMPLSAAISIESTRLPRPIHDDPADQLIVASARQFDTTVLTVDRLTRSYAHVRSLW